jgi:hypothetical protein
MVAECNRVALTHLVCTGWNQRKVTSTLAFDIAQFFPSLNHVVLVEILKRFGFSNRLCSFFSNYLTDRKTQYSVNSDVSELFTCDVGVGQGSALLSNLSALYISPIFHIHIFDSWIRSGSDSNTPLSSFLSFVDDGLLIATDKDTTKAHNTLCSSYRFITDLFTDFGLVMEHSKTELFNFDKKTNADNPSINLGFAPFTSSTPLIPKKIWRYLGFYFDCILTFRDHVKYYATKSISAAKCMRILGNSSRGLSPKQK